MYLYESAEGDRRNLLVPLFLLLGRGLPLELDCRLGGREEGREGEGIGGKSKYIQYLKYTVHIQ